MRRRRVLRPMGNTPAYAGKTSPLPRRLPGMRKHPRLRGEDTATTSEYGLVKETPPLTRGRLSTGMASVPALRNTPAYAGKTRRLRRSPTTRWKHPRLRGEDPLRWAFLALCLETPPLTRGRQPLEEELLLVSGNTPAYAGKTPKRRSVKGHSKKHPRLRGEDLAIAKAIARHEETPPLTRGRLLS